MPTITFTPQNTDVQFSAFSALSDLANTARSSEPTSPWMMHNNGCRCLLCR